MDIEKPSYNNTQQKILNAAIQCVQELGFEKTSLNDIAKVAGVTRPTVYSYFPNRFDLIRDALIQSGIEFGERMLEHIEPLETIEERLVESIVFGITGLPKEPYLAVITRHDLSAFINQDALSDEEGQRILLSLFKEIFKYEEIDDFDLLEICELATRLLISMLMIKGPYEKSEEEQRDFLKRRMLPALAIRKEGSE